MTDKQIIIDYENLCESYSKEVGCYNTFDGSCIKEQCFTYRLLQLLKTKEQECEELKSDLTDLSKIIDCKNGTILTFKEQLDRLKQTVAEIKEICNEYQKEYILNIGVEILTNKILQII